MTRVSPGLNVVRVAQFRAQASGTGGFHDHLAAVRGRERVELQLVVLKAGAGPGVADPDRVAVTLGTHHAIVPETVPELNPHTLVVGRIPGRVVLLKDRPAGFSGEGLASLTT
jgi:hypothetical protein